MAAPRNKVLALMRRWRQIDVCITKAANEAKDNSKFLSTLEKGSWSRYERHADANHRLDPSAHERPQDGPHHLEVLQHVGTDDEALHEDHEQHDQELPLGDKWHRHVRQNVGTSPSGPCSRCSRHASNERVLPGAVQAHERQISPDADGRQFDFPEAQLFGKFDLFCRRLIKLIDVFSTIQQFRALVEHKLEGMEPLLLVFDQIFGQFRRRSTIYLITTRTSLIATSWSLMSELGSWASLQHFINRSFDSFHRGIFTVIEEVPANTT